MSTNASPEPRPQLFLEKITRWRRDLIIATIGAIIGPYVVIGIVAIFCFSR